MNQMNFEFSDTITGYVTGFDREKRVFTVKTSDGREYSARLTATTYAKGPRNLGEGWCDYTGRSIPSVSRPVFVGLGCILSGTRRVHVRR
jgi:thioredoxin reductase